MELPYSESLRSLECPNCNITFAITATVERKLRNTGKSFNCPNGHSLSYNDDKEIDQLKKLRESDLRQIQSLNERVESYMRENKHLSARINSLLGVITRLRKRLGK